MKTANDYGKSKGHLYGNKLLLTFTDILRSGEITNLLKSSGLDIYVAAQSGDEYLILIISPFDLKNIQKEIE